MRCSAEGEALGSVRMLSRTETSRLVWLVLVLAGAAVAGSARAATEDFLTCRFAAAHPPLLPGLVRQVIETEYPGWAIAMPESFDRNLLQAWADARRRAGEPVPSTPAILCGDFGGSGRDFALLLRRQGEALLLALHWQPGGTFRPFEVFRGPWLPYAYLEKASPGMVEDLDGKPVQMPQVGIRVRFFRQGEALYFFDGTRYQEAHDPRSPSGKTP